MKLWPFKTIRTDRYDELPFTLTLPRGTPCSV